MRCLSFRSALIGIVVGAFSGTVFAQSPGYRLELSDGASGWVILVNDSQKPIEAFSFTGECGSGGTGYTYDALNSAGESTSHPAVDGHFAMQHSLIQPGQRFFALEKLLPQPSGCTWEGHIKGVIYVDGTHAGEESAARDMQASRDGIAAALRYWTKLNEDRGENSDERGIYTGAEQLAKDDYAKQMFPRCNNQPVACAYWKGRYLVDTNIALQVNQQSSSYASVKAYVERWLKKVDADDALRHMDAEFPLSTEIEAQSSVPLLQ